ncbi:hypothetical protein J3R30DRAFT_3406772 [Lentinula aciculospora]|uniref:Uncharacterized protein n=1 Tax=Lentinula aciculospora TaxID=153920 RepID=A0A9W9A3Z0_9AGAR|nr:hypothetical protein J3R30DRAFT_3406772 [Lentinula aciculospora]
MKEEAKHKHEPTQERLTNIQHSTTILLPPTSILREDEQNKENRYINTGLENLRPEMNDKERPGDDGERPLKDKTFAVLSLVQKRRVVNERWVSKVCLKGRKGTRKEKSQNNSPGKWTRNSQLRENDAEKAEVWKIVRTIKIVHNFVANGRGTRGNDREGARRKELEGTESLRKVRDWAPGGAKKSVVGRSLTLKKEERLEEKSGSKTLKFDDTIFV